MTFCRESHLYVSRVLLKLPNEEEKIIEINPGEAYGTGNQPPTKLCIEALENICKERKVDKVLDVGCGSGILAICAVALGANTALALDIDPVAVEEARINVEKNGFSSKIRIVHGTLNSINDKFDLVLANLTASNILSLSEKLKSKLKSDGLLLVSGIWLTKRKEGVIHRFQELGLFLDKELSAGEWFALLFKRS
jgi:ribosomal protein L11 methyltransferase